MVTVRDHALADADASGARPRHRGARARIDAPGVDTAVIIRKYDLPDAHSRRGDRRSAAARHAGARAGHPAAARISGSWPTVTIDGEHARDFDDAISIDRLANGNFWLGVHIADVAHYVTEGSALDARRTSARTSVYFPERAVHMFPSELATGLCSLNPHVDRLVQSCLMEVDRRTGARASATRCTTASSTATRG